MTISYNWLSEYLPEVIEPNQLSTILTSVGLEVESMEKYEAVKGGLEGILIGKVIECIKHPDSDHLSLTKIYVGSDQLLNIVCGAPNVAAGQTVIVAPIGSTIYPSSGESITMKKAKIRGQESEGMICAEDELGLGASHDGIMLLPDHLNAGMQAKDYFQIPASDIIYEIGLTPNRMDAMSHMGVAKDVCAYLSNANQKNYTLKLPTEANHTNVSNSTNIDVIIEDGTRCARYAGVCIQNIEVKDSPEWLQTKLKAIGLRPINNIVDITNFVMHECGQPLHAFDLNEIKGNKIIVKTVSDKTKFTALDGKEIELCSEDLMICNVENEMCIAGVYGGLQSGVKGQTTSLFLESAWFQPESIRKSSMRHGLRTDAATRFEKGADISQVIYALKRAASLICEIAGGQLSSDIIDVYPNPMEATEINLDYNRIRSLAGKQYSDEQIQSILTSLCFGIKEKTTNGAVIKVPFSKPDITMQADIVEEIMRIDGLDNIPFTGRIEYKMPAQTGYKLDVKKHIASQLVAKGCYELFTNSITNAAYYPEQSQLVKMMNSLSANLDAMRYSMLETGLEAISYNLNRKNNQLKFYEFGRVYKQVDNAFVETDKLALYFTGNYNDAHWSEKGKSIDVFYVKGILDGLFNAMKLEFVQEGNELIISFRKQAIGKLMSVSSNKLKEFDIKQPVWYVDLDWNTIKDFYENRKVVYKVVPKFPLMKRDLALILDKNVEFNDIQKAVKQAKSKLLQDVDLFDVFESEKIGLDKKSYAINLSFYHNDRTLTDAEVESEMKMIITSLESKVGAIIRGN
jgi:phenylalanyl-tRNA synthetase beta chain